MTRFDRQQFFERLVTLRGQSAAAGAEDRGGVLSVEDAVAYAIHLLQDHKLLATIVDLDPTAAGVQDGSA
jgi:hypothetical protein